MRASQRQPVRVTSAGRSHAHDLQLRQRRYLLTQAVRVACVLLAVLLPVAAPWKIGFIALSVVLPWFGVVAANAGPVVERRRELAVLTDHRRQSGPPALEVGEVIEGDAAPPH